MNTLAEDQRWMDVALGLSRRGLGTTWPNPTVGCVLVKNDRLMGRGWTQPQGRPHAETMALAQAGSQARGTTAYVTLEPCAHHGKTPPCSQALILAGVTRVVIALKDPDSRVLGKGIADLQAHGIHVDIGVRADEARNINEGFLTKIEKNRPFVTLKLASSLDGNIATRSGESRWITGKMARSYVHLLRSQHDGILIGVGTARADQPSLDVRLPGRSHHRPVPIILGGGVDPSCYRGTEPLWWLTDQEWNSPSKSTLKILTTKKSEGHIDLHDALHSLAVEGLTRILCEGGGQLAASLLRETLVDEIVWFHAGMTLGADALPSIATQDIKRLTHAHRFELISTRQVGCDVMSVWRP